MAIYYLPRAPSGICTEAGAERHKVRKALARK
jgi:hypothetical protein